MRVTSSWAPLVLSPSHRFCDILLIFWAKITVLAISNVWLGRIDSCGGGVLVHANGQSLAVSGGFPGLTLARYFSPLAFQWLAGD
jgi:hypothetical protein